MTAAIATAELSRVPVEVEAHAQPLGRLPFGFGRRFFVGLVIGLAWLVPAWWEPRFVAAMFLWDALLLAAWYWDFSRLPAPREISVRRVRHTRPALSVPTSIDLRNSSDRRRIVQVRLLDEIATSLAAETPELAATLPAGGSTVVSYSILLQTARRSARRSRVPAIPVCAPPCGAASQGGNIPDRSRATGHRTGAKAEVEPHSQPSGGDGEAPSAAARNGTRTR